MISYMLLFLSFVGGHEDPCSPRTIEEVLMDIGGQNSSDDFLVGGNGVEISDGIILTVSHVIEDPEALPKELFTEVKTIETNSFTKAIAKYNLNVEYNLNNELSFPRPVFIISNTQNSFVIRQLSQDVDSYVALPVLKFLFLDPSEKLSD